MIAWERPKSWILKTRPFWSYHLVQCTMYIIMGENLSQINAATSISFLYMYILYTYMFKEKNTSISFISLSALGGRTCVNIILVSDLNVDVDIFVIMIIAGGKTYIIYIIYEMRVYIIIMNPGDKSKLAEAGNMLQCLIHTPSTWLRTQRSQNWSFNLHSSILQSFNSIPSIKDGR